MQEVLGEQVRGVGSLHTARGQAQKGLSAARMRGLERQWRKGAAGMGWEGGGQPLSEGARDGGVGFFGAGLACPRGGGKSLSDG